MLSIPIKLTAMIPIICSLVALILCRPQAFRVLLADCGWTDTEHPLRLVPLPVSETLFRDLERLDRLPERDTMTFSVFYAAPGASTLEHLFTPQNVSKEFVKFLWTLGWPVIQELTCRWMSRRIRDSKVL